MRYNITVVGSGYVGMSLSVLLGQNNNVCIYDIDNERVDIINQKRSTIHDKDIESYLANNAIKIHATSDQNKAYRDADFIIIATPTDYDDSSKSFDTSSVDNTINDILKINKNTFIIIKSTIPVGYTKNIKEKYGVKNITFSPEFLREGSALKDNLYPSRIVIGSDCERSKIFVRLLKNGAISKEIDTFYMKSTEAEAVKLFSNTYLAMRVSFFNELDSYAHMNKLNTKNIIDGISTDSRIGKNYNNPSFGYGGYCLPKDTKQLLSNYDGIPQTLIHAIVESNKIRKDFIASQILKENKKYVGFYRLIMKEGSNNYRSSAILGVISRLKKSNCVFTIYEPSIDEYEFEGIKIEKDLNLFKKNCNLIIANRISNDLDDVKDKVFTRDIYKYS